MQRRRCGSRSDDAGVRRSPAPVAEGRCGLEAQYWERRVGLGLSAQGRALPRSSWGQKRWALSARRVEGHDDELRCAQVSRAHVGDEVVGHLGQCQLPSDIERLRAMRLSSRSKGPSNWGSVTLNGRPWSPLRRRRAGDDLAGQPAVGVRAGVGGRVAGSQLVATRRRELIVRQCACRRNFSRPARKQRALRGCRVQESTMVAGCRRSQGGVRRS